MPLVNTSECLQHSASPMGTDSQSIHSATHRLASKTRRLSGTSGLLRYRKAKQSPPTQLCLNFRLMHLRSTPEAGPHKACLLQYQHAACCHVPEYTLSVSSSFCSAMVICLLKSHNLPIPQFCRRKEWYMSSTPYFFAPSCCDAEGLS